MGAHRQQIFATALNRYQAGEPVQADAACRTLLAHWPHDVDALNLRAVIACMAERHADGIGLAEQVLAQHPDNVQALSTLADALYVQGNMPDAVAAFERAVKLAPRDARLRSRLGTALLDIGRVDEAETAYRQSIALADHVAQSHFNHAVALCSLDRTSEAIAAYRKAIALEPHHVAAHLNLGNTLMDQNQVDEAIATYVRAFKFAPGDARIHCNLAVALLRLDRIDDAADACRTAITLDPLYASAHTNLGLALQRQDRLDEAIAAHRTALALAPEDANVHCNLAVALLRLDRIDEAIEACHTAIALNPKHAAAYTNLGVALQRQDRLDEAIAAHRRAISLEPESADAYSNLAECQWEEGRLDESFQLYNQAVSLASCEDIHRFNHALALLMAGDYEAGWPAYEVRRKAGILGPCERSFAVPEWRGEALTGRTLLLHAEQGLGDTLQFVRYVRQLLEPGVSIVIEGQKPLAGLLQSLGPVRVVTQGEPLLPVDFHLPLMSLPNVLRTRLDTIPAAVPYLAADPAKIARWKDRIGPTTDLAVGVVWSGNPGHKSDRRRSIAAAAVLPDLVMPGVRLFSLQKDPRDQDITTLEAMAADVTDLSPSLNDFSDTAAALEALDLVIAVDTSTAHLAGALGRPVWLMLPFALDWRWLRDREDSPWYPTMRLFRQSTPRVWTDVIGRVRTELSRLAPDRRGSAELPGPTVSALPAQAKRGGPRQRRHG